MFVEFFLNMWNRWNKTTVACGQDMAAYLSWGINLIVKVIATFHLKIQTFFLRIASLYLAILTFFS